MTRSVRPPKRWTLVALLLLGVSGCTTAPPPAEPAPPSAAPTPAVPWTDTMTDRSCRTPAVPYSTKSPAYAGPAPHPVTVIDDVDNLNSRSGGSGLSAPLEWNPEDAYSQLIACVERRWASDRPSRLITCEFELGTPLDYEIVEGDYRVTVREARTGRTVGAFTVAADESDEGTCPVSVMYRDDGTPHSSAILRGPNTEQFTKRLRPYVFAEK